MKKELLSLVMMLLPIVASADNSGSWGDNLAWAYVESSKTLTISGTGSMRDCGWQSSPWYAYHADAQSIIIEEGITSVGVRAFMDFSLVKSVIFPKSLRNIGAEAFHGCSGLTELNLGDNLSSIGNFAFWDCSGITSVDIPLTVTNIGEYAFDGCSNLKAVHISDLSAWCKINLGRYAFGLVKLFLNETEITNLSIPDDITTIGDNTFCGFGNIINVTIGDNVTSIGNLAFDGCRNLISVSIAEGVESIGESAFSGCNSLVSIEIPNSVTSIGGGTFSGCSSLTSVIVPDGVTSIERHTFAYCSSLLSVDLPDGMISIGELAFIGCSSLATIKIPPKVTSIGFEAFIECSSLTSVYIPESVVSIGTEAFYNCSNLKSVNISNITAWSAINFGGGYSNPLIYAHHLYLDEVEVTEVAYPNNTTSIGQAFRGCWGINTVTIPNNVTNIDDYAFEGCRGLTSILIPNSITSIGEYAFQGCSSLRSVSLPNDIVIIKRNSFNNCYSLNSIIIPANVEYIYQEAFANCSSLKRIEAYPTRPPFLYDNSFSNYSVPLKVPKGCKGAYQSAQGWKNFTTITDAYSYYKLTYMVDGEEYRTYEIEEGTIITPEPAPNKDGYTFSGWSEIPETMPAHDVTVTGYFTPDIIGQCAMPTIAYSNGKLSFSCETEDVEFHWSITNGADRSGTGNDVAFAQKSIISVYATKAGYKDSDIATMEISNCGEVCDVNKDGAVDVADIATIISKMAGTKKENKDE